jgi:hypothetical protein
MSLTRLPTTDPQGARVDSPLESQLPRPRPEAIVGTVTFIAGWLASHAKGNSCEACEGLGFCTRCDARGCEDCHGGLCERCKGMGLRLDAIPPGGPPTP